MGLFDFFKKSKSKTSVEVVEEPQQVEEIEPVVEKPKEEEAVKRIKFLVKGTFPEERQKAIKKLVKELKDNEYFYLEPYDGLKNKEIKEDYFEEKIYEYGGHSLPKGYIENEDDNEYDENAIKVFITNLNGEKLHIGYVPKELCLEIRSLVEKYEHYIAITLQGGKYKIALYDEYGEEKVKTYTDEYGIEAHISFWESLPDVLKNK